MRDVCCLLVLLAGLPLLHAEPPKKQGPTPDQALQRLIEGNKRFLADQQAPRETFKEQRARLATGQQPFAIVLTCADSRVVPEFIFNQQLGDIFVVRVAGNVTDPAMIGSIEYAVEHLHTPLVVVMGHSSCGAVQAVVDGAQVKGNLGELLKRVHVGDDLPKDKKAALTAGIRANVLYQAGSLTRQSTVIKDFANSGRVKIVAGVYALGTGEIEWLKLAKAAPEKKP